MLRSLVWILKLIKNKDTIVWCWVIALGFYPKKSEIIFIPKHSWLFKTTWYDIKMINKKWKWLHSGIRETTFEVFFPGRIITQHLGRLQETETRNNQSLLHYLCLEARIGLHITEIISLQYQNSFLICVSCYSRMASSMSYSSVDSYTVHHHSGSSYGTGHSPLSAAIANAKSAEYLQQAYNNQYSAASQRSKYIHHLNHMHKIPTRHVGVLIYSINTE